MEKTTGDKHHREDTKGSDSPVRKRRLSAAHRSVTGASVDPLDTSHLLQTRSLISSSDSTPLAPDGDWRQWGPYLAERQWATVRESDCSSESCSVELFSHSLASHTAYQWGEDGLMGFCDSQARLCLSLALWNGEDPFLKERLYGLTGAQGNHGEDVKELYYYLDGTPTHRYMRGLYKYPQTAFPYDLIETENEKHGVDDPEYELLDTGVFDDNKYWDVYTEYSKRSPQDILIRYTITNQGPSAATLYVLPTIWFRNTWSGEDKTGPATRRPQLTAAGSSTIRCSHPHLKEYMFVVDSPSEDQRPTLLFTNNESRSENLPPTGGYTKDGINQYVVHGERHSVNSDLRGTKAAALYHLMVGAGDTVVVRCRLSAVDPSSPVPPLFGTQFDALFTRRISDTDRFYSRLLPGVLRGEEVEVGRQAYAGLCWGKQFYCYDGQHHSTAHRNPGWRHMFSSDVISMPDKWEFPWFASWDLAFQMVPYARIDPNFAKQQMMLLLSERYMNYNGQIPGCEFDFSDINPPVVAWAVLKIHRATDTADVVFLRRCFHKLLFNFTWCLSNRNKLKQHGFLSGFLGMDNISCVDRSKLPDGVSISQADGVCWMAFYCTSMLDIALELAAQDTVYEDVAIQMLKTFAILSGVINGTEGAGVWDDTDGFYYDSVEEDGVTSVLRVRSLVGLTALFPVLPITLSRVSRLSRFTAQLQAYHLQDQTGSVVFSEARGSFLLTVASEPRLRMLLSYMLNENEFLSPFGIRSLSKFHKTHPFSIVLAEKEYSITYSPGESNTDMFGGNSNWRGPVWMCMNVMVIESLESYDRHFGDSLRVNFPSVQGQLMRLGDIALQLCSRLTSLFLPDGNGRRPSHGGVQRYSEDPTWKHLILFYEYFDGDTGRGCGASHQTGWTALVSHILDKIAAHRRANDDPVDPITLTTLDAGV